MTDPVVIFAAGNQADKLPASILFNGALEIVETDGKQDPIKSSELADNQAELLFDTLALYLPAMVFKLLAYKMQVYGVLKEASDEMLCMAIMMHNQIEQMHAPDEDPDTSVVTIDQVSALLRTMASKSNG